MFGLLTALFRSLPRRQGCADLLPLDDAWLRRTDSAGRAAFAAHARAVAGVSR